MRRTSMPSGKDLILIFSLNEYKFAIDVDHLVEVTDGLVISEYKDLHGHAGEIDFHGRPTTLIDLKEKLFIKGNNFTGNTALVVRINDRYLAFQVDSVDSVVEKNNINHYELPDFVPRIVGAYSFIYEWNDTYVAGISMDTLFKKIHE